MKQVLVSVLITMMLSACAASNKQAQYSLLQTLNIGVLENTRLLDWRMLAMSEQDLAQKIVTLPYDALLEELEKGNLDLIVGLPEIEQLNDIFPQNSAVIATREFDFIVASNDQRNLTEYVFQKSFLKKIYRLGYVANDEFGVVNEFVLPPRMSHQTYIKCQSLEDCQKQLMSGEIDAIYGDLDHLKQCELCKQMTPVGFEQEVLFTVFMNTNTLTENEQDELSRIFSHNYEKKTD